MATDLNRDVEMNSTDPKYSKQTQEKVSDGKKNKVFCEVCCISMDRNGFQSHLRGKKHNKKKLNKDADVAHHKVIKTEPESLDRTQQESVQCVSIF